MSLNNTEKETIIDFIKNNEPLPKEYIYKLFADEEDVFLFWNGRNEEVTNVVLPFHSIEHIDEPRKEVVTRKDNQLDLFSLDTKGRQLMGWTNKLIWGDNKLVLSSLVNGPMRDEIEKEGGLKLIYIDPPFAVGADFSFNIEINGESAEKKQSVIEEIAYRDTWGHGISSYLAMMYERLKLMHQLLADDGSIYVHCDWRVSSYLKIILESIFGYNNFINDVIWHYRTGNMANRIFQRRHDIILFFSKSDKYKFSPQEVKEYYFCIYGPNFKSSFEGRKQGKDQYGEYRISQVDDVWDISAVFTLGSEHLPYPTQKPEKLIERILNATTNEGDLVADFFCGSGTMPAVAEKNNRKWIACDLGRFAIHTTRKRLIAIQRQQKEDSKDFRAFEVLNLGKYERQFFMTKFTDNPRQREQAYISLILEAYKAQPIENHRTIHGKKANRMIHVGPLDVPVTKTRLEDIFEECKEKLYTSVDVLGFEFEMGLVPYMQQELREKGVDIRLRYIPKEVFDKRVVEKGQARFYDVSYLSARPIVTKRSVTVTLTDFITNYTQDDIEDIEQSMRSGSKVVIENGQIVKLTKDKDDIRKREVLTDKWSDWIDYWSVDFDYSDKKEIIKIHDENGEIIEKWTGNYIFENEWQSFRTKKAEIEFTSAPYIYDKAGRYKLMVKVVDILGIDTSQVIEVTVK